MAYRNFSELLDHSVAPRHSSLPDVSASGVGPAAGEPDTSAPAELSALEWLVVSLARKDTIRSLRAPGRLAVALGTVFGGRVNPRLADPRLEALRRLAVLSWHRGYSVASAEVRAFTEAGFTLLHYETMMLSIGAGHAARNARRSARGPSARIVAS